MPQPELPPYDPEGTESIEDIPARFLHRGELGLRGDGVWTWNGDPVTHARMSAYLLGQLRRTAEGEYWVVNGPQRVLVSVEDTPFLVKRVYVEGEGEAQQLTAKLNDGSVEALRPGTLEVGEENRIYATVKWGEAGAADDEGHRARFSHEAIFALEPLLQGDPEGALVLRVAGRDYSL